VKPVQFAALLLFVGDVHDSPTMEPDCSAPTWVRVLVFEPVVKIRPFSFGNVIVREEVSDAIARVVVKPSVLSAPSNVRAFSPAIVPPTDIMSPGSSPTMTLPCKLDKPRDVSSPNTGVLEDVRMVPDSSGKVMTLSEVGLANARVRV
jgi:hypothetical protein